MCFIAQVSWPTTSAVKQFVSGTRHFPSLCERRGKGNLKLTKALRSDGKELMIIIFATIFCISDPTGMSDAFLFFLFCSFATREITIWCRSFSSRGAPPRVLDFGPIRTHSSRAHAHADYGLYR